MGLVFEPTPSVQVQAAPKGEGLLLDMKAAYRIVSDTLTGSTRELALDGLNNLYRSKTYRDWIKEQVALGHLDKSVVQKMESELLRWRHQIRHPVQKAWRRQWP